MTPTKPLLEVLNDFCNVEEKARAASLKFNWQGVVNKLRTSSKAYHEGFHAGFAASAPLREALGEAIKVLEDYSDTLEGKTWLQCDEALKEIRSLLSNDVRREGG